MPVKGVHICPECKDVGVRTVYDYASGLGVHRKNAHGVIGTSVAAVHARKEKSAQHPPTPPTLAELVEAPLKKIHKKSIIRCFYCERSFPGLRWRTRHIHESHPGMDAKSPTVVVLNGQKGINESEEDKAHREYAINRAGFLEGLCYGMAAAKDLPPEEFTAGVAKYLVAFTVR